ncbi:hypothetical protein MKX01_035029 [Papaver californicum]|nr:hypothetical protein MKX01_035029 [Papaver californicum]
MSMISSLEDLLKKERYDPNVRDEPAIFCAEWYDYNEYFDSDDDDDGDKKPISEVSGTGMDTQLFSHDGERIKMGIIDEASAKKSSGNLMSEEPMEEDKSAAIKDADGDALEEDMSSEMKKKKEKRKSQEDGVQTDTEGKKKNKSLSTSDV